MSNRIDHFPGDDGEYVKYLESTVRSLRAHHLECRVSDRLRDLTGPDASPSFNNFTATDLTIALAPSSIPSSAQSTISHEQPKRPKAVVTGWKGKANTLVRATPKADRWRLSIANLGLYEAMRTGEAAMSMLDGSYPLPGLSSPRSSGAEISDLFGRLEAYAHAAVRRNSKASLALMLANFQKFLLLSSCAVLYHAEVSKEKIYQVLRICLGDITERYCVHILRTVKYINQLIDALNAHGWKDRASELYLICQIIHHRTKRRFTDQVAGNEPPSWYSSMASSPRKSLQYLKERLSTTDFTAQIEQSQDWTPLFIPSLVHQILGKKYQYVASRGPARLELKR